MPIYPQLNLNGFYHSIGAEEQVTKCLTDDVSVASSKKNAMYKVKRFALTKLEQVGLKTAGVGAGVTLAAPFVGRGIGYAIGGKKKYEEDLKKEKEELKRSEEEMRRMEELHKQGKTRYMEGDDGEWDYYDPDEEYKSYKSGLRGTWKERNKHSYNVDEMTKNKKEIIKKNRREKADEWGDKGINVSTKVGIPITALGLGIAGLDSK